MAEERVGIAVVTDAVAFGEGPSRKFWMRSRVPAQQKERDADAFTA